MMPILLIEKLGFPFETDDPFLFCAHHKDAYPNGDANLAPAVPLAGRGVWETTSSSATGSACITGATCPGFLSIPTADLKPLR